MLIGLTNGRGRAKRYDDIPSGPPDPSVVSTILQLNMNQASGPMLDSAFGNHGTVTGSVERGLSGILTGSSASAASDGSTGIVTVLHTDRYSTYQDGTSITDFAVYFWAQMDVAPATQYVLVAKDAQGVAGGWSIELWNDGGTIRLRAYIRNSAGSATWIGSSSGFGTITAGTAFRAAITYESGIAKLYLDDGAALGAAAIAGGNPVSNTEPIHIFGYGPGVALFDGIIDDVVMKDGSMTQAEIEALDDAVSIVHDPDTPLPPSTGFSCPDQSGTSDTNHYNLGTTTVSQDPAGGTGKKYDFRLSVLTNTYTASGRTYTPSYNIHAKTAALYDSCMYGGTITKGFADELFVGTLPAIAAADNRRYFYGGGRLSYPSNHGGQIQIRNVDHQNILIDGFRFHQNWDAVRIGDDNDKVRNHRDITIRQCWFTDNCDDAIENDSHYPNIVVDDCLFERTFVYWSDRNGSSKRAGQGVCTTQNSLVWVDDMHDENSGSWYQQRLCYKLSTESTRFDIFNTYFRFDAIRPNGQDPFYDLRTVGGGDWAKLRNSSGNVILWTPSSSYPGTVPPGFTVQTGSTAISTWEGLLSAWKSNHSHVPRVSGYD